MGCFLFQLPASYGYTKARLTAILSQLDPSRRNVVEFRHARWWNQTVYAAFRQTGTIFCSCSGPRLPDDLIRTADDVCLRLNGPKRWYRHDYSKDELSLWADKIKASGAKLAGRLVAVHKLRTTARNLETIIGEDDFTRLQDMWAQDGGRYRWSVAFPIVESYRIVGRPKAKTVLGDALYRRLYQRSSATLGPQ